VAAAAGALKARRPVYLFHQLLEGRFDHCRRVLDAGCGSGRNLVHFLRGGFDVFAVDREAGSASGVRELARAHGRW
jgi:tellurite methyltransferase